MYVYIYVCMYVCMYVSIYLYIYIYIYIEQAQTVGGVQVCWVGCWGMVRGGWHRELASKRGSQAPQREGAQRYLDILKGAHRYLAVAERAPERVF